MHERDQRVARSRPGLLVDQLGAFIAQVRERGRDVVDPVGDVVQARASRGERPSDRRRRVPSAPSSCTYDEPTANSTSSTPWSSTRSRCEGSTPSRRRYSLDRGLEVWHGDAHVVDVGELDRHGRCPSSCATERRLHARDQVVGLGHVVGGEGERARHRGHAEGAQVGLRLPAGRRGRSRGPARRTPASSRNCTQRRHESAPLVRVDRLSRRGAPRGARGGFGRSVSGGATHLPQQGADHRPVVVADRRMLLPGHELHCNGFRRETRARCHDLRWAFWAEGPMSGGGRPA